MVGVELFVQVLVIVLWAPPHPRFKPGAGSSPLPRRGEGTIVGCRSIAASFSGSRERNWLVTSYTRYSVADVARPSVVRTVDGRWSVWNQSIFVYLRCCSLGRSTKRSDVCRVERGFARTLNGQTPGREGDQKSRPYVLRVSVWLAGRSRLPAPHPSPGATSPQWPGCRWPDCRSALRPNLSSTSGGHRRGPLGQASDAYTILCRPSRRPGFNIRLSISLVKGAHTLDATILLGAGADGRLLWRLVVIVVHALRECQARIGDSQWVLLRRGRGGV